MLGLMNAATIRTMNETDLSAAWRLSTSVGWNQIMADWQRMLLLEPAGCFVAERGDDVVGTTLCCTFGPVAWLAMVIVREDQRGCGLGRELVRTGLDYARQNGVRTVRLDATRLGEAVYRKLGFRPQYELVRMGGVVATPATSPVPGHQIVCAESARFPEIDRLDREGTRTNRQKLLHRLFSEWMPSIAISPTGAIDGFLASREGRLATQFGPMSGTEAAALDLLNHALEKSSGQPVIADIPVHRQSLLQVAQKFGLTEQRTLLRMCYGDVVEESPQHFHLSYGGEFG
jgi:predicted N-acetyltransferase YhbS